MKHGVLKHHFVLVSASLADLYSLIFLQLRCMVVKSCRYLMAPANGRKSSNDSTCGATVTFDCDECYELEGLGELSCLENETWSGDEPTCTGQFLFLELRAVIEICTCVSSDILSRSCDTRQWNKRHKRDSVWEHR